MKRINLLLPLLLGALLTSTLVGVAGARPNARPEASPALKNHMISAHHCILTDNFANFATTATSVTCLVAPPACTFVCPIKPPHEGVVRVQRIAMYAFDNDGAPPPSSVCMFLEHVYPKTASNVTRVVNLCTANSPAMPQVVTANPANFKVSVLQDLYVAVTLGGPGLQLYGLKVKYEPL
jgi:hypothetical protein